MKSSSVEASHVPYFPSLYSLLNFPPCNASKLRNTLPYHLHVVWLILPSNGQCAQIEVQAWKHLGDLIFQKRRAPTAPVEVIRCFKYLALLKIQSLVWCAFLWSQPSSPYPTMHNNWSTFKN
ncbi:hypothetical protein KIL84_015249 [Mauremys mutica]|uniref:Uncharacterized protein n=1 Tax=Mauremys mutica TaxID=74926 RepID=A0A9D4AM14_9SAUR|nr:hypothetical protein KIL84_015249 [Mauremys mutica]